MKIKFKNCKTNEIVEIDGTDLDEFSFYMTQGDYILIFD